MPTIFKGVVVTEEKILEAMKHFDTLYPDTNSYDGWLDKATYKWAIVHDGRKYPTKLIISRATGLTLDQVKTAKLRNKVLRELGFTVTEK